MNEKEEKMNISRRFIQYEEIINRPENYIGSTELQKEKLWVYNNREDKLEFREIKYPPGLLTIFNNILINASDNIKNGMKYIEVRINPKDNIIEIKNDGKGIQIGKKCNK